MLGFKKAPFGAKAGKFEGKPFLFANLKQLIRALLQENRCTEDNIDCIITSGLSESEIGLCEIPHADLPMDLFTEAAKLCERVIPEITDIPLLFVPGLKKT